jgi:redox-sensitive bicupin YhaK (pirin superfamily)
MNNKIRGVIDTITPQYVREGAGVLLRRSIATRQLDYLDPFLLFDHFGSDNPEDYLAGFPTHPHRGIETVTYMLEGLVEHRDSIGNEGEISAGDVQWMTAGRGILHEEMPKPKNGLMEGFQLWVNLPAKLKMGKPRYQELDSLAIPEMELENGVNIRLIAGMVNGIKGAVTDIAVNPTYLDIHLPKQVVFEHSTPANHTAFAYIYRGQANFGDKTTITETPTLVIFGEGNLIKVNTTTHPARFLLISGKPLNEPIARYGPFVMNTRQEIEQTLKELREGTFIQ